MIVTWFDRAVMEQTVALLLESDQSERAAVMASMKSRPMQTRITKALRVAAPLIAVGVAGALIPMLHFVIVPAALIAAIVFGLRELLVKTVYQTKSLRCPHCEATYDEQEFARLPKRLACFKCRVASELSIGDGLSSPVAGNSN